MKKLKKRNFKKLALMGMAGGTLLASQAQASEYQLADSKGYSNLLAMGCGGGGARTYNAPASSCSAMSYSTPPQQSCSAISYNPPHQSCSAASQSCSAISYSPRPQQSCSAMSYNPPAHSCSSAPASAQYYTDAQGQWQQGQPPQSYTSPSQYPMQGQMQPQYPGQMQPQYPGQTQPQYQSPGQMRQMPQSMGQQSQNPQAYNFSSGNQSQSRFLNDPTTNASRLTESQLLSQLNDQARSTYQSLDAQGKALALKLANQTCKGQNDCKGLNSCKTDDNSCAGKGSCAGKSKGPFQDKNLAVKVAAMKMADKRSNATSPR
jgi:hypothetical protein